LKKLFVLILTGFMIFSNIVVADAADLNTNVQINTEKLNLGIITVSYRAKTNSKIKVIVEKNSQAVTYNLKSDGTPESFPLQMGDGGYKVSILENVEGNKYKYVSTENVNLDLANDNQVYLESVQNINWDSSRAAIKKAGELTKGLKTDEQKIVAIYQYLVSNVTYDYDKLTTLRYDYLPDIDRTIAGGKGICYDFASTFAAMLRSQGIPAKLVKGYAKGVSGYHAWNEVYDSETGEWETIDTTYDSQMKAARKEYSMIKSSSNYDMVYEY